MMSRLQQLDRSIVHDCADAIIAKTITGAIVSWNHAAERLFGYAEDEALGRSINMLLPPDYVHEENEILARIARGQRIHDLNTTRQHKSGALIDVSLTISPLYDATGLVIGACKIARPNKQVHSPPPTLLQSALYDPLTKTANRALLVDRLEQAMRHGDRQACYGGVLFLDLDGFKAVNDNDGHRIGDLLLQRYAERLKSETRGSDTVARWGGDEFVVLLPELNISWAIAMEQLHKVASKLQLHLRAPYTINGKDYSCPASIGGCLFSGTNQSVDAVIEQADRAMYGAKRAGKNALQIHSRSGYDSADAMCLPKVG